MKGAEAGMNGVLAAGLLARLLQPVDIFALVPEFQGIWRHQGNSRVPSTPSSNVDFNRRSGARRW